MADIPLIVTTTGSATNAPNAANNTINPTAQAVNALLDTTIPGINNSITAANTTANSAVTTANATQATVTAQATTIATVQSQIATLQATVASLGASSKEVFISTQAGITPGTVTDSRNGLNTAIQNAATNGQTLVIDCNLLCTIGYNVSKPIFIPPNCSIRWEPGCAIYIDNVCLPFISICNSSNVTFENYTTCYIGSFGSLALDAANPTNIPGLSLGQFNDSTSLAYPTAGVKYYLQNVWGNSFTGSGSSVFPSNTNANAQILISGQVDNLYFRGTTRAYVPANAPAYQFIPFFMSAAPQWNPGILVTTTMQVGGLNNTNASVPNHVVIDNLELDGYCMGVCGTFTNLVVKKGHNKRYSDLQDANGNNVGGQVYNAFTLASTNTYPTTTSATLAVAWPYPSRSWSVAFSDGEIRTVSFVNNSQTITWTGAIATGLSTTIQVSFSQYWVAPPHAFYLHQWDLLYNFPSTVDIQSFFDEGLYVGTPNRRSTSSGFINTMKFEPANNSSVRNYVSNRLDGGVDILSFGSQTGEVQMTVNYNSSTSQTGQLTFSSSIASATQGTLVAPWPYGQGTQTYTITFSDGTSQTGTFINGQSLVTWPSATSSSVSTTASVVNTSQGTNYFYRFPSSPPTVGVDLDITAVDNAIAPVAWGGLGDGQYGNTGINIKVHATINDVPYGTTWTPGPLMGGSNITYKGVHILKSMSTAQAYLSSFYNGGSTLLTESNIEIDVIGWRSAALAFVASYTASATLTAGAQSCALNSFAPATASYYLVYFSTGESRFANIGLVSGVWTAYWQKPLLYPATTSLQISTPVTGTTGTLYAFPYGNGIYTFSFQDGETRQVTVTGTSCSWTGNITGVNNGQCSVLLLTGANVDYNKNRTLIAQGGRGYGNYVTFRDATNGITQTNINLANREVWTQTWNGPITGTSVTTDIVYPVTFAVTSFGYVPTATITGPTSLSIGWTGSLTALVNAGGLTTATNPWSSPGSFAALTVPTATDILITLNGGTATAGSLMMSVTAERTGMSG